MGCVDIHFPQGGQDRLPKEGAIEVENWTWNQPVRGGVTGSSWGGEESTHRSTVCAVIARQTQCRRRSGEKVAKTTEGEKQ